MHGQDRYLRGAGRGEFVHLGDRLGIAGFDPGGGLERVQVVLDAQPGLLAERVDLGLRPVAETAEQLAVVPPMFQENVPPTLDSMSAHTVAWNNANVVLRL